jgi:hypothetical protein
MKHRNLAASIAVTYGFHTIAADANRLRQGVAGSSIIPTHPFKPRASRVAHAIECLRPGELPIHVSFVAAA